MPRMDWTWFVLRNPRSITSDCANRSGTLAFDLGGSRPIGVSRGSSQGAAGTIYVALVFTNTGAKCAIWGVPKIQPVTGSTHLALGPYARNVSMGQMAARHVIGKGGAVSVALGVEDTGNFPPSTCVARNASGVLVSLEPFVRSTFVRTKVSVCTRRVSTITQLVTPGVTGN